MNISFPPPIPPPSPQCQCDDLIKDLSCVAWGSTQHIELAVCLGVFTGVVATVASYFTKKWHDARKQLRLAPIPETSMV